MAFNFKSELLRSALVAFGIFGSGAAFAQSGSAEIQPAHSEWAGYYQMAHGSELSGFSPVNQQLDPVIMAHLRPWALQKIKETNGVADDMGAVCNLAGIFRHPSTIGAFYWLPVPGKIVVAFSRELETAGVRRIYITDKHPPNLSATYLGHSIGRWEKDALVVDSIGFNDKTWLMSGMEPHTEALHVIEHIRSVANGSLLEFETTVEDREALTTPYSFTRYYKKTDAERVEDVCNADPGEQSMWVGFRRSALKNGFRPQEGK